MIRFILLSFGFLGWTFYEMSGGSEFDAEAIRTARLAAIEADQGAVQQVTQKEIVTTPTAVVVAAAPAVTVDADPVLNGASSDDAVTRVSLNLTSVDDATAKLDAGNIVPQNVSLVTSSADTPAIIPSLIDPNDGGAVAVSIPTSAAADIRTVSGNRVNVRGGPGTDFNIVARLTRGQDVRILQDDGNGWVRFETVDGGTGGWLADFLLTGS